MENDKELNQVENGQAIISTVFDYKADASPTLLELFISWSLMAWSQIVINKVNPDEGVALVDHTPDKSELKRQKIEAQSTVKKLSDELALNESLRCDLEKSLKIKRLQLNDSKKKERHKLT